MTTEPGTDTETLVEVHLQQLPVAVWARTQEHIDGLLREFTLIVGDSRDPADIHVPAQLLQLVEELQQQYDGVSSEQGAKLARAAADGVAELELTYLIPPSAADASVRLGEMLDAADRYCQQGEHLLTLAAPPETIVFRRWYLEQFVGQTTGRPAQSWPDWVAAHGAPDLTD